MAEKENTMVAVCNTHTDVETDKYVSVSYCIADKAVDIKNIIEDTVSIESDMYQIEPLEVLHGTLLLEGNEMGHNSDWLLKIILSNLEATSKGLPYSQQKHKTLNML